MSVALHVGLKEGRYVRRRLSPARAGKSSEKRRERTRDRASRCSRRQVLVSVLARKARRGRLQVQPAAKHIGEALRGAAQRAHREVDYALVGVEHHEDRNPVRSPGALRAVNPSTAGLCSVCQGNQEPLRGPPFTVRRVGRIVVRVALSRSVVSIRSGPPSNACTSPSVIPFSIFAAFPRVINGRGHKSHAPAANPTRTAPRERNRKRRQRWRVTVALHAGNGQRRLSHGNGGEVERFLRRDT
jgi:hypothetical protein